MNGADGVSSGPCGTDTTTRERDKHKNIFANNKRHISAHWYGLCMANCDLQPIQMWPCPLSVQLQTAIDPEDCFLKGINFPSFHVRCNFVLLQPLQILRKWPQFDQSSVIVTFEIEKYFHSYEWWETLSVCSEYIFSGPHPRISPHPPCPTDRRSKGNALGVGQL